MENWVEITIHTTNEASEIVESILLDYGRRNIYLVGIFKNIVKNEIIKNNNDKDEVIY